MKRSVFFVSDRTGITAETLGHALLTQFEGIQFKSVSLPFIDTAQKAEQVIAKINRAAHDDGSPPLVFTTLIDPEIRALVSRAPGLLLDFFDTFISPLEEELGVQSCHAVGRSHGMGAEAAYKARIDAVNFALAHDDGATTTQYPRADIVLIGVSRSGKTPTCLYLALQYGVLAANYPLTEEDLGSRRLPEVLAPHRQKLFGLTIDAKRLHRIRSERRPDSRYASLSRCHIETQTVRNLYRRENIPFTDTTAVSIEEIATTIMHRSGLERRVPR